MLNRCPPAHGEHVFENSTPRRIPKTNKIHAKKLTRDDALVLLNENDYEHHQFKKDYEFFLRKFNFTEEDFLEIMDIPEKNHDEFPSNAKLFRRFKSYINKIKKYSTLNNK